MELISRIRVRRHEMGESGENPGRPPAAKCLHIFRVLGKSPERARRLLSAAIDKEAEHVMVLATADPQWSENQKRICQAALEQDQRRTAKIVFCGGDPSKILGRLAINGGATKWFPSIPAFVASHEIDTDRPNGSPESTTD